MKYTYLATDTSRSSPLSELEIETIFEVEQAVIWTNADPTTGVVIEQTIRASAVTHRETTTNQYREELKIGHRKITEGVIYVGSIGGVVMRPILDEVCTIRWKDDPTNPGHLST